MADQKGTKSGKYGTWKMTNQLEGLENGNVKVGT